MRAQQREDPAAGAFGGFLGCFLCFFLGRGRAGGAPPAGAFCEACAAPPARSPSAVASANRSPWFLAIAARRRTARRPRRPRAVVDPNPDRTRFHGRQPPPRSHRPGIALRNPGHWRRAWRQMMSSARRDGPGRRSLGRGAGAGAARSRAIRTDSRHSRTMGMTTADACAAAATTSQTRAIGSSGMNGGRWTGNAAARRRSPARRGQLEVGAQGRLGGQIGRQLAQVTPGPGRIRGGRPLVEFVQVQAAGRVGIPEYLHGAFPVVVGSANYAVRCHIRAFPWPSPGDSSAYSLRREAVG